MLEGGWSWKGRDGKKMHQITTLPQQLGRLALACGTEWAGSSNGLSNAPCHTAQVHPKTYRLDLPEPLEPLELVETRGRVSS